MLLNSLCIIVQKKGDVDNRQFMKKTSTTTCAIFTSQNSYLNNINRINMTNNIYKGLSFILKPKCYMKRNIYVV